MKSIITLIILSLSISSHAQISLNEPLHLYDPKYDSIGNISFLMRPIKDYKIMCAELTHKYAISTGSSTFSYPSYIFRFSPYKKRDTYLGRDFPGDPILDEFELGYELVFDKLEDAQKFIDGCRDYYKENARLDSLQKTLHVYKPCQ